MRIFSTAQISTSVVVIFIVGWLFAKPSHAQSNSVSCECSYNVQCTQWYSDATQFFSNHEFDSSFLKFNEAYSFCPDPRLLVNSANALQMQRRFEDATSYYEKFLRSPVKDKLFRRRAQQCLALAKRRVICPELSQTIKSPVKGRLNAPESAASEVENLSNQARKAQESTEATSSTTPIAAALMNLAISETTIVKFRSIDDLPRVSLFQLHPERQIDNSNYSHPNHRKARLWGLLGGIGAAIVTSTIVGIVIGYRPYSGAPVSFPN